MKALFISLFASLVLIGAAATPAASTDITFATDWKAQAEHGGFYQALAKGYYKNYGLNVRIRPGGPQSDNPRLMAAGALDIAMASNNFQPLNLIAAGADVKVVMASFQKDPQVLMVHPHVKAAGFADLKGMPVFIGDSAVATFWPWLKARFDYTDDQIRKYTYSLAPWMVNKNTVQEGYLSSEPFTAETAGVTPRVFLFADEGYPGYAAMIMVRGDYLSNNKKTVDDFVKATIEGWREYMWGDRDAANALILKDNPDMTPELLAYAHKAMLENDMLGSSPDMVGQMTDERWQTFYDEMAALGIIEKGLNVKSAYTLDFLPQNKAE